MKVQKDMRISSDGKMSRAVNWALDKAGYKQSTVFGQA